MAVSRTRTIKNKHAAKNSGIKQSKSARAARAPPEDGVLPDPARRKGTAPKTVPAAAEMLKKLKKKKKGRTYTAEELGIPKLNMITPAGVTKPRGQKKGKVFVDDRKSMAIIMAIVQAEKSGQVESKITKARQMEEIREARRLEAEDRDRGKQERLEDAKDALRKRRKRKSGGDQDADRDGAGVKKLAVAGTNTSGTRPPGRRTPGKRVRFA